MGYYLIRVITIIIIIVWLINIVRLAGTIVLPLQSHKVSSLILSLAYRLCRVACSRVFVDSQKPGLAMLNRPRCECENACVVSWDKLVSHRGCIPASGTDSTTTLTSIKHSLKMNEKHEWSYICTLFSKKLFQWVWTDQGAISPPDIPIMDQILQKETFLNIQHFIAFNKEGQIDINGATISDEWPFWPSWARKI